MDIRSMVRRRPWMVLLAVLAVALVFRGWVQDNRAVVVPSLVTLEQGAPDAYDVPLDTPLLIDDERDRYQVTRLLHDAEVDQLEAVDLDGSFLLLASSQVCAPYLRMPRLVLDGDDWWVGERPVRGDITDLYNLCEDTLVDFHIFEIDRVHLQSFDDVTRARSRPR